MSLVIQHGAFRRPAVLGSAAIALVLAALLGFAARAQAAETVYWQNFGGNPDSIAFANIDGTGGGALNLAGTELEDPEGMAYDTASNRLFVGNRDHQQIAFVNLDGSGAGALSTPGVPVINPVGVAIDPNRRAIYWINDEGPVEQSIGWAKLDGSGGGILSTEGATLEGAARVAIDPAAGRIYWGNDPIGPGPGSISFANLNDTGGGDLDITGAAPPENISGVAVDPAAGRLYWLDSEGESVSFASLGGGGGGDVNLTAAAFNEPWGLALDPSLGKLYWGNEENGEERAGAIGFGFVAGGGGGITPLTAPVANPQDPVILKSPSGASAPSVARDAKLPSQLICSQGTWAGDFSGSNVYQAPRTFAYRWTRDGVAIAGATAATLNATEAGGYACVVTAANQAGTASQNSAATQLKAAKVKLTVKRKARIHPGGVATFKVTALNQGDVSSKSVKVCVKAPKKAKRVLKARKCKSLGALSGGLKRTAKLKIKVGKDAAGTYNLTFQVRGSAGTAAKAKIVVLAAKK
jgi:DNA-binding beta-propeller fold protein YncE